MFRVLIVFSFLVVAFPVFAANFVVPDSNDLPYPDFNEDCKTDIEDFAMLAVSWLSGYQITEPTVK